MIVEVLNRLDNRVHPKPSHHDRPCDEHDHHDFGSAHSQQPITDLTAQALRVFSVCYRAATARERMLKFFPQYGRPIHNQYRKRN